MKTVAIVMAAGAGARFASSGCGRENKLTVSFRGKPLYTHALDALDTDVFSAVIVVSGNGEILAEAKRRGFIALENYESALGVSRTIRLGTMKAVELGADAALYAVADQPLISRETIGGIVTLAEANPEKLIVPKFNSREGNPVLFPRKYFAELMALTGDTGGKKIVRAHAEDVVYFDVADARELTDADTREALTQLQD